MPGEIFQLQPLWQRAPSGGYPESRANRSKL